MYIKKGRFYSIGTGPGDPGLLTLKAVETLKRCQVVAVPDSGASENIALSIVKAHLEDQQVVYCDMPMTRDSELLETSHQRAATALAAHLESGEDVGFLTLGDPAIYSTALYVHQRLQAMGFETEVIPGVPSFCAVAAKLNVPLCEGGEMLHVVPASYSDLEGGLGLEGSIVLMKSGKSAGKVKSLLAGRRAMAVERCGLSGEKLHADLSTWTEDASYFSVLLVKGENS